MSNNTGKLLTGVFLYFLVVTTNILADEMNKKLVLDQPCFELLSQTLAEFGESVLTQSEEGLEYRYEISCKENELEILRFQKSAENTNFIFPRGGGPHYRTFAIEDGKVIETTPASR